MAYRNKTYVIFDGDNDQWAYRFMRGWRANDSVNFDLYDAHEEGSELTDRASEDTVKRRLRERFSSAKQVIVLIGEHTNSLYRFVRWELQVALELELPIIAVHLKPGPSWYDWSRIPPIIRSEYVLHLPFKAAIIQFALGDFLPQYRGRPDNAQGPVSYSPAVYRRLGLFELIPRASAGG